MATITWKNAFLAVNGVDYSSDVQELTLNYSSEMLDATVMGLNTRTHKGGLKNWSIETKFLQNFATGRIGSVLFALIGTTSCVEIRPDNSCSTAINPSYSGIGIADSNGFGGAVGILLPTQCAWQAASDLSRASSS